MGCCGHQFSSPVFHQIVDFSTKSSLVYQKLFCAVTSTDNDCLNIGQNSYHCTVGTTDQGLHGYLFNGKTTDVIECSFPHASVSSILLYLLLVNALSKCDRSLIVA